MASSVHSSPHLNLSGILSVLSTGVFSSLFWTHQWYMGLANGKSLHGPSSSAVQTSSWLTRFPLFSVVIRVTNHEISSRLGRQDWPVLFSVRPPCSWVWVCRVYLHAPSQRAHPRSLCGVSWDAACSGNDHTLWSRNAMPDLLQSCHRCYKSFWKEIYCENVFEGLWLFTSAHRDFN